MPRYVILEHDHPQLHWDFMLEVGGVLRTWRLAEPPPPGERVAASASFDHRTIYLDYEGPVSGGRGAVKAWDRGTFEAQGDVSSAERVVVNLRGTRLNGTAVLERGAADEWWLALVSGEGEREASGVA
jgi:hypothetical protein